MHSEQHEDDCLFCKMLFFHQKFIGWQLLCLASADSCEVCNNVNHKTDIGHVSMTSNLPGSPGKTGDDKKLVKSVNRGNWITLVERHRTPFPILIPKNTFEIPFIMKQITKPMSVSVPHRTSTASHLTVISLLRPELTNV